ncbi:hypothetical protein F7U66_00830 [Vibrio parahaemolyticus]|nr:hypothetical protein [Vibrio parahaemolyticus]
MIKKVFGAVLALGVLVGAGTYAYVTMYNPTDEVVVVEPDVEIPLKGVLVQFDNAGFNKLVMVDMVVNVRPESKEHAEKSLARMRNQLVMNLVGELPKLYGQPMFEMNLQKNISNFLSQSDAFKVESALITRVVVQ